MLFHFTALRQSGETYSGEREAKDKHALIAMLGAEGSTALSVENARAASKFGGSILSMNVNIPFLSRVPANEKILFARNLSAMTKAGLSLSRALAVLKKQTRNAGMKQTIAKVDDVIRQGGSLYEALRQNDDVFSPLFVAMARAGEESGTLAESLQIVATQMERSHALTRKIRGAMIYPAIVITVMIAIGVLMLIYVVPTLSDTFSSLGANLPLPTRIVLTLSNFVIANSVFVAAGAIAIISALVAAVRTPLGTRLFDRAVLMLPVIGPIVAKVNAARTARTLSSLLSAGVPALSALTIAGDVVQNTRFRPVIMRAREFVEKGKPLSEAFVQAENIYPIMFAEMAAVGEETGDMAGMLTRVASFYEEEVEQQTKDLSTIIEPILMVVIGGGVGFFAIAMIMPIYSLSSNI